jgi:hypothetical protein
VIENVYDNDGVDPRWIKAEAEKRGSESLRAHKKISPCGILYLMKSVATERLQRTRKFPLGDRLFVVVVCGKFMMLWFRTL